MPLEIRKYRLENMVSEPSRQAIEMPAGARVLSVQEQGGGLMLWAAVDPTRPRETRTFALVKTGRPLEGIHASRYIGTVQTHGGSPVWHVFEA